MTTKTQHRAPFGGFVSLSVMAIIVLITYACYGLTVRATLEHRTAAAYADRAQLELCADSAEAYLLASLQPVSELPAEAARTSVANRGTRDESDEKKFAMIPVGGTIDSARRSHFTIVGHRIDEGRVVLQYGPTRESSKLSLWAVADWERKKAGSGVAALTMLPGVDVNLAANIVSFLTGKPVESLNMESGRAPLVGVPPAIPTRTPLPIEPTEQWRGASLDELLRVRDVTAFRLYGGDRNANGLISPRESEAGEMERQEGPQSALRGGLADAGPLASYLTAYSAEGNNNRFGEPRINLNHSDLVVLEKDLAARLPAKWVRFIMAYRQCGAGTSNSGSGASSPCYITSVYDLIDAEVTPPDSGRSLQSPFQSDRAALRGYLMRLVDEVTVDARRTIPGRIDINTAPEAVLRTIPEVDEELVERIVAVRGKQQSDASNARYHPAWLAAEGWIDVSWLRQLEPYITCGGDVYRAQVVSYYAPGEEFGERGTARTLGPYFLRREILMDASEGEPLVIARRDLTSLGRGYAAEVLAP